MNSFPEQKSGNGSSMYVFEDMWDLFHEVSGHSEGLLKLLKKQGLL